MERIVYMGRVCLLMCAAFLLALIVSCGGGGRTITGIGSVDGSGRSIW